MGHFRKDIISILLTEKCNLSCQYCYLNKTRQNSNKLRSISADFAKKGIEDYFREKDKLSVRFFAAGEPTVEFKLMQEIWQYSYELAGNGLYAELQTNGCFSENVCQWICAHIDMTWISCDGPKDIQDFLRPQCNSGSSSFVIENNVEKLAKAGKNVGIRATINKLNIYRQKEMIDYFSSLGVNAIFADLICAPIMPLPQEKHVLQLGVDSLEYAKYFLEAKEYAESKGMFYSSFLIINFDEPVNISCRCMLPSPHLNPSGYVSACDMAYDMTGTALDHLIYGYYDEEAKRIIYDENKIERIRTRSADKIPHCNNCDVKQNCAGGCFGESLNETNSFWGVKKDLCEGIRFLGKALGTNYNKPYKYFHP